MCRLFGFRSVVLSKVHSSLVAADNALLHQSGQHPDGWGVAYYHEGAPHVIKSVQEAGSDHLFQKVSGVVSSQTVLAHLRKATAGPMTIMNTHPFQFGPWVFAHNGNIKNFSSLKPALLPLIDPDLRSFVMGESDSEVIFHILLSHMKAKRPLSSRHFPIETLGEAVLDALKAITAITGPYELTPSDPQHTYLTFIITNGLTMLGFHGGQPLLYSTYKSTCPERDGCPNYAPFCEAKSTSGRINHLVLASESLKGTHVFVPLKAHDMIGVDHQMMLFTGAASKKPC